MSAKTYSQKWLIVWILITFLSLIPVQPTAGNDSGPQIQSVSTPISDDQLMNDEGELLFVTTTGTGTDCNWANPGPLEYCVEEKAQPGDTIFVKQGYYYSQKNPLADNLLFIQKSINLIGSCRWSESEPIWIECYTQNESPFTTPSYLIGSDQQRVIAIQGPGITVSISGFQIQQGNADHKLPKPTGMYGVGGGIYAENLDRLLITGNYIWSNKASDTGTASDDYSYGGGIYASDIKNLEIRRNTLQFNSASSPEGSGQGGGMFVKMCGEGGQVEIVSNRIQENFVGDTTTNSMAAGAELLVVRNLRLDDNIFEYHNHTMRPYWTEPSALLLFDVHADSVAGNDFNNNYGSSIVQFWGFTGKFSRNKFWNNVAEQDVTLSNSNYIQVSNNFFGKTYGRPTPSSNETENTRGGISAVMWVIPGYGAHEIEIIHNTFALAPYGIRIGANAEVDITRNIFTNHTIKAIDVIHPDHTIVNVNQNLFWDNTEAGVWGTTYWANDPMLVDMWNGDFHLQPGSAAIDKVFEKSLNKDFDNDYRPMGLAYDVGADEYFDDLYFFMPLFVH